MPFIKSLQEVSSSHQDWSSRGAGLSPEPIDSKSAQAGRVRPAARPWGGLCQGGAHETRLTVSSCQVLPLDPFTFHTDSSTEPLKTQRSQNGRHHRDLDTILFIAMKSRKNTPGFNNESVLWGGHRLPSCLLTTS